MQTCTLSQTGGIQPNKSNTEVTVFHQLVLQWKDRLSFWLKKNSTEFTLKEMPPNGWCQFFSNWKEEIYWACNNELMAVQDFCHEWMKSLNPLQVHRMLGRTQHLKAALIYCQIRLNNKGFSAKHLFITTENCWNYHSSSNSYCGIMSWGGRYYLKLIAKE